MGYETRYSLETRVAKPHSPDEYPDHITAPPQTGLIPLLRSENDQARSAFTYSGECCGDIKWYDHEDDLIKFSSRFPGVLFILSGFGEERGDIWRKYFYEGKCQTAKAKLVFQPIDHDYLRLPDSYCWRE